MPRININEQDFTSPGRPSDYANYSVLVLGFEGAEPEKDPVTDEVMEYNELSGRLAEFKKVPIKENNHVVGYTDVYNRPVEPDDAGVFEFTSKDDFEKTIGKCAPGRRVDDDGNQKIFHYGNQMAYELLKLGYTVIYKPIKTVSELAEESTWEIFKDKAKYDFRFIVHGLNESDNIYENFIGSSKVAAKHDLITIAKNEFSKYTPNYKNYLTINVDGITYPLAQTHYDKELSLYRTSIDLNAFFAAVVAEESNEVTDVTLLANSVATALSEYVENTPNCPLTDYLNSLGKNKPKTSDFETYWNLLGTAIEGEIDGLAECVSSQTIAEANECIANLAAYVADKTDTDNPDVNSGRGDCIALIELDENLYNGSTSQNKKPEQLIIDGINNNVGNLNETNSAYCALTVPSVFYKNLDTTPTNVWEGNNKLPGSFHYLACFMSSLKKGYREWYAAAGYTRGVSSYVVDHTKVKLGEIAVNALEPRHLIANGPKFACNVIANFRGSYYLWGNRTAFLLGDPEGAKNNDLTASSFLNIRQLCTTIKKQLYVACRRFTFDPNDDTLWFNFCNAIKPTLELMKADQGVRDYKILKAATDKKATLKVRIRIIPIEAVEDFILEVSLEDSFGETSATIIG